MIEYELRSYQTTAAETMVKRIRQGLDEPGEVIATLSAPTGAGKTIIAASAIDELLFGSDAAPGDTDLVVLWLSMSPALNEQTAEKFRNASGKLAERTRIIDPSEEYMGSSLEPGRIYFLNPQKLRAGATQYRVGDHRKRDLWETLNGTFEAYPDKVVVFIDEAHIGTGKGAAGDETLMGQLINGTGLGKHKAPVVVGISATPERFEKSIKRNTKYSIPVDIEEVRAGGLVKDQILIGHPDEDEIAAADVTLLMQAVRHRAWLASKWEEYTQANSEPTVDPILLVQLPANVAEAAVAGWLEAILEADPGLTQANIVNALEGHSTVTYGRFDIRYVDPTRIHDTAAVKVVLFKDALTTGWDCPRAEALFSFRGTKDPVTIAQLIGRTVRTPLAKKVNGDDELNAVKVWLPHFQKEGVDAIVAQLNEGDNATASEVVAQPVRVERNPDVPAEVWEAFTAFPTWSRPKKTARSATARLVSASMVLSKHGALEDAPTIARKRIVDVMLSHLAASREFVDDKVAQFEEVDYVTRAIDWLSGQETGTARAAVAIASRNILDLYKQAKSRLPDASAVWLWEHLVNESVIEDTAEARLVVAALAMEPSTVKVIEDAARSLLESWKQDHLAALSLQGGQAQADFLAVFTESKQPELIATTLPDATSVARAKPDWPKHLLSAVGGQPVPVGRFPFKPANTWEERVLDAELRRPSTIAWYRNPTGGSHAIAVPYGEPGARRMLYPDFVVFGLGTDGNVTVSIVDPHRPDLGDTLPKWLALGQYAAANAERLARVWAVIDDKAGDELLFLDLLSAGAREALGIADQQGGGEARVREAFEKAGGRYS